jgi:tagatose-1,6-bisphosphate aldolase non-catalytic subunit AgaZ/GatZ
MGGANVGPEFTMAEYGALMYLVADEAKLAGAGKVRPSRFKESLTQAVVDSGRWKKWLHPDEQGKDFAQLTPDRQDWLTQTGCRYIWTAPVAAAARSALYKNLATNGVEGEPRVVRAIAEVIAGYIKKFNLGGLQSDIERALAKA